MSAKYYLAGPVIADDDTKRYMDLVYEKLTTRFGSNNVFRPGLHKVPNAWGISMETWGQCVFTMDVIGIDSAEWIVLCNFGRKHQTAGTAWECGYAFAKEKKILVVNMPGSENDTSLMITGCAANIITLKEFIDSKDIEKHFFERGRISQKIVLN